jgi:hypothetical protein
MYNFDQTGGSFVIENPDWVAVIADFKIEVFV